MARKTATVTAAAPVAAAATAPTKGKATKGKAVAAAAPAPTTKQSKAAAATAAAVAVAPAAPAPVKEKKPRGPPKPYPEDVKELYEKFMVEKSLGRVISPLQVHFEMNRGPNPRNLVIPEGLTYEPGYVHKLRVWSRDLRDYVASVRKQSRSKNSATTDENGAPVARTNVVTKEKDGQIITISREDLNRRFSEITDFMKNLSKELDHGLIEEAKREVIANRYAREQKAINDGKLVRILPEFIEVMKGRIGFSAEPGAINRKKTQTGWHNTREYVFTKVFLDECLHCFGPEGGMVTRTMVQSLLNRMISVSNVKSKGQSNFKGKDSRFSMIKEFCDIFVKMFPLLVATHLKVNKDGQTVVATAGEKGAYENEDHVDPRDMSFGDLQKIVNAITVDAGLKKIDSKKTKTSAVDKDTFKSIEEDWFTISYAKEANVQIRNKAKEAREKEARAKAKAEKALQNA